MMDSRQTQQAAQAVVQHLANHHCDSRLTILYVELCWEDENLTQRFDASGAEIVVSELLLNHLKSLHGHLVWSAGHRWLLLFGAPALYDNNEWRATRMALLMRANLGFSRANASFAPYDMTEIVAESCVACVLHTFSQFQLNASLAEDRPFEHELHHLTDLISAHNSGDIILETSLTRSHTMDNPGISLSDSLGSVAVAPNGPPTEIYRVDEATPFGEEVWISSSSGLFSPMVGRDQEFQTLTDALQIAVRQSVGGLMTIFGESGIGKSRLIFELHRWAGAHPDYGFWMFHAQTTEQMTSLPFSLIRRMFAARFEIRESDPDSLANQKLVTGFTAFLGEDALDQAHFIGHLLGYDFSDSPHIRPLLADPRQIRDRAFHYVVQFFRKMAGVNGWAVVLTLEDIQLTDVGSLDLIRYLAQHTADVPMVIVATAQASLIEHYTGWGSLLPNYIHLHLERLSPAFSQKLLENLLHNAPVIPPNFTEILLAKAAGNPYHLEELVKSLIQADIIQPGNTESEEWKIRDVSLVGSQFPATLPDLVRERVQSLPTDQQAALLCASVIGRVFWDSAVADLCGWSSTETRRILEELVRREMIFEREVSAFNRTTEYTFSHETLHSVCYDSISPNLLRHYHARVATWLIGRGMERVGQIAGLIAEHFARAGETQRAVKWYGLAGRQARDTYAPEAAIDYFQTALSLLPYESDDIEQRMALMEGVGRSLQAIGQYAAAAVVYRDLAWVAGAEGNLPAQSRALSRLATVQDRQGQPNVALETSRTAVSLAEEASDEGRTELITALLSQASSCISIGNLEAAFDLCTRAHEIGVAIENREQIVYALNLIGVVHSTAGRYAQAMQVFNEAMWLAREMGDVRRECILSNNLGELGRRRGEYRKALALFQHAAETARSIAYRSGELVALSNIGVIRVYLGDFAAAEQHLRSLIPRLEKINHTELLGEAYCYLGEALDGQARFSEALYFALQALATARHADSTLGIGVAWRTLGRIAYHMGQPIRVDNKVMLPIDCFKESLRLFTEGRMEGEQAQTLRTWAHFEIIGGDFAKGEKMWYQARAVFTKVGADAEVQRMERLPHDRRLIL